METLFALLGESGVNLLVMIGITPNNIDGLMQIMSSLPRKVIIAKLRALKAAGLIHRKEKDAFFLTDQGKSAFRSLMKLYEL
jgi:predicted transcriptional regulator